MSNSVIYDTRVPIPRLVGKKSVVEVSCAHCTTLEPAVPEIRDRYLRQTVEFSAGGPLGHSIELVFTDEFVELTHQHYLTADGYFRRAELLRIPLGFIDDVSEQLRELGYEVKVCDRRRDSKRWALADNWRSLTPAPMRKVIEAIDVEKALRVVAPNTDVILEVIDAVSRAFLEAKIAIAVPTQNLLNRFRRRLRVHLPAEKIGIYTSQVKRQARISVGLIRQLPRRKGQYGEFDLLILPYAVNTVGNEALRVILSGQFRRILSFTRCRWTRDEWINRRLAVIAGTVFPPEVPKLPVTVVVLGTHGTKPVGKFASALHLKRKLYWLNPRRNRRIAEVAKRLVSARKSVLSSVIPNDELVEEIRPLAKAGVAIMVEVPEHAAELAKLLPGWAVWTANDIRVNQPAANCGVITTELAAIETVIAAGVMIRATGTMWALPDIGWPRADKTQRGVLVDFADEYHPVAARYARSRIVEYQQDGRDVWLPDDATPTKGPPHAKPEPVRANRAEKRRPHETPKSHGRP